LQFFVFNAFTIRSLTSGVVARSRGVWPQAFFKSTSTPYERKHSIIFLCPAAAA